MDKRQALRVLIDNSYILSEKTKNRFREIVDKMTDEEVEEWGELLSEEQNFIKENQEQILTQVGNLVIG